MKPETVWTAALGELQLQMTAATFDQLLRGTTYLRRDDGLFVVGVKNAYAKDWLTSRLSPTIERTLTRLAGERMGVRFEVVAAEAQGPPDPVTTEPPADPAAEPFVVPGYDVLDAGWFKVAQYERTFWGPVLGRVAFAVVEIVRQDDRRGRDRTTWTPRRRYTAPGIAALVPCGRQALLGVKRRCGVGEVGKYRERYKVGQDDEGWWFEKRGAFDLLAEMDVANIERRGELRHTTYLISVRNEMGLLTPELAALLPDRLQVKHDAWLADHGFEPQAWDVVDSIDA